jgi:hypothetical protein
MWAALARWTVAAGRGGWRIERPRNAESASRALPSAATARSWLHVAVRETMALEARGGWDGAERGRPVPRALSMETGRPDKYSSAST